MSPFGNVAGWVRKAAYIWRLRQAMAGMDGAMQRDIGLCASAAAYEASKPFWDLGAGNGA